MEWNAPKGLYEGASMRLSVMRFCAYSRLNVLCPLDALPNWIAWFESTRFWKLTVLYAPPGLEMFEPSTFIHVEGFMDAGIATHVWLGPRYTRSPNGLIAIFPLYAVSATALLASWKALLTASMSILSLCWSAPFVKSRSLWYKSTREEPYPCLRFAIESA